MYERYEGKDAYRLEEAVTFEAAGFDHCRQATEEIVIPARWIGAWLVVVVAIIATLAAMIGWLA